MAFEESPVWLKILESHSSLSSLSKSGEWIGDRFSHYNKCQTNIYSYIFTDSGKTWGYHAIKMFVFLKEKLDVWNSSKTRRRSVGKISADFTMSKHRSSTDSQNGW